MDFSLGKSVFDTLYSNVSGYDHSAKARRRLSYEDKSLTYGEVAPSSFKEILDAVSPKPTDNFYDLGSGTGKAVFLARFLYDFAKTIGIEKLDDLYHASKDVLARYDREFRPMLPLEKQHQFIDFIHADFLEYDFSDADVIFVHSTCFYDELMANLERRFITLKVGTRIITVTRGLSLPIFALKKTQEYQFNWGRATTFFYEKIS